MNYIELRLENKVWILTIDYADGKTHREPFCSGNIALDEKIATAHANELIKKIKPCYYTKKDCNGKIIEKNTFE